MSLFMKVRVLAAAGTLLASTWGSAATPLPLRSRPILTTTASSSVNWSGYVSEGGPFDQVSATWTQPTGTCASSATYSSFWVGLDGAGTNTVEQTGAEVDCSSGRAVCYAWYEMYPRPLVRYGAAVHPGDQMSAQVTTDGAGNFTLAISDVTRGWTKTQNKLNLKAKGGSAEVVAEAPASVSSVLPLTNFGTVSFIGAQANGLPLAASNPLAVTMVSPAGVVKAQPSPLSADGTSFQVAWQHS